MGSTTLLSDAQVRAALEPTSLAPAMEALFRQLARGEAENLPRSAIRQAVTFAESSVISDIERQIQSRG